MSSVWLSSMIVGNPSIPFLIELFGRMAPLNMNSWVVDRHQSIVYPNSVHLGDTLLVSREKVATCSKHKSSCDCYGVRDLHCCNNQ